MVWIIIACLGVLFFVQTLLLPEHVHDNDQHVQGGRSTDAVQIIAKDKDRLVEEGSARIANRTDDRPRP